MPYFTNFGFILVLGQLAKDLLQLPRPAATKESKSKVEKLELHFGTEFGMPSTHTMAGFLPLALMLRAHQWGFEVSNLTWTCCIMCVIMVGLSRLYMGVHSVMDIAAGAVLAAGIMSALYIASDDLDHLIYNSTYAIYIWIVFAVIFWNFYPRALPWTASIGTSAQLFGPFAGFGVAMWYVSNINDYYWKVAEGFSLLNNSIDKSDANFGFRAYLLRTFVGFVVIGIVKVLSKELFSDILIWLYQQDLVRADPKELFDADGKSTPIHKLYCVEVPVR